MPRECSILKSTCALPDCFGSFSSLDLARASQEFMENWTTGKAKRGFFSRSLFYRLQKAAKAIPLSSAGQGQGGYDILSI
jgi:hypothetical protein